MFQWYDYLPTQYENLIVGIDYTNYCFSLLLFGLSIMLTFLGKKALAINCEVVYFYYFLTVVWIFRACLASFIEPWPLQPIPAAAIGQLVASDVLAVMMVIVSGCLFYVNTLQTLITDLKKYILRGKEISADEIDEHKK